MRPSKRHTLRTTGAGGAYRPTPRMERGSLRAWTLNIRLLVLTLIAVGLLAPSLYAVRSMQLVHNSAVLFEQAKEFEVEKDYSSAARTLYRYLQFRPDDGPARVLLAQVFDKSANTEGAKARAAEHYYAALAIYVDRTDLRARLAEILFDLGRNKDAQRECIHVLFGPGDFTVTEVVARLKPYQDELTATRLLEGKPEAGQALNTLARVRFVLGNTERDWLPEQQLALLKSALQCNPNSVELTTLLARTYRERLVEPAPSERAEIADELMTRMAQTHSEPAKANLALYRYRLEFTVAGADEALEAALAAEPKDYEVLLVAADNAKSKSKHENAASFYTQAINLSAKDPRAHIGLAQLLLNQGKTDKAIAAALEGLDRSGQDQLWLNVLLLNAKLQAGDIDEVKKLLPGLRAKQEIQAPLLSTSGRTRLRDSILSLEADLAAGSRQNLRAAKILRQLALPRSGETRLEDDLKVRSQRWGRLGYVYDQLRYHELAARAYDEQARLMGTRNYGAKLAAGKAWMSSGRLDTAVIAFTEALEAPDAQAGGWLLLAQAELERQTRRANRDWTRLDAAIKEAARLMDGELPVEVLKVQVAHAKGQVSEALRLLSDAIRTDPRRALPFAVLFYKQTGHNDEARSGIEQLKSIAKPDDRDVRLLEVELARREKNYAECEKILAEVLLQASDEAKYDIRRQLASIAIEAGSDSALEHLTSLHNDFPGDPWPLEQMADLALSRHDFEQLEKAEGLLRQLEGVDGSHWRFYRGMRLTGLVNDSKDPRLEEAALLQKELQSLRPAWPATLQLLGRIAQKSGRIEEAASAYQAAVEAGATSVTLFEGLVTLLYANNRWSDADAFLNKLQQVGYRSPVLDLMSSRVSLRQGDFGEALRAARAGAKLRSKDPVAQLWLGQTLTMAANQPEATATRQQMLAEAKESFEKAIAIAPDDFRAWGGLLWFSARTGDQALAQRALQGLETKAQLEAHERLLALGQAHQQLGQYAAAEARYLKAAELLPRDVGVQERLAQFYMTYSPEKAEQAFRRVLQLQPDSKSARRALAMFLVSTTRESRFKDAIELLKGSDNQDSLDRRLEAILLMQRGGKEDLHEARRIVETLVQSSVSDSTDRQLLAVLAETNGDLQNARQILQQLAEDSKSPSHLAALIEFLLRHADYAQAGQYVQRLRQQDGQSWPAVQLEARWLKGTDRPAAEVESLIDNYQRVALKDNSNERDRLGVINRIVVLLDQLKMHDSAYKRFEQFVGQHPTHRIRQSFVLWLIRSGQFAEATNVALAATHETAATEDDIQLLSNVLTMAASRGLRFAEAEARLDELTARHTENATVVFELATLRHMQGNVDAADRLYRRAISLNPANAFARNNFAFFLLEQTGSAAESLKQVEEALRLAGPVAEIRDTYAIVLAENGRAEEACQILRGLLSRQPTNPRYLFHLAWSCWRANNNQAAREALSQAKKYQLDVQALTPGERKTLDHLTAAVSGSAVTQN